MTVRTNLADAALLTDGCDAIALPLFESDLSDPKARLKALKVVDEALGGLLLPAAQEEGFTAKRDQLFLFHTHGKIKASRVILVGMGQRAQFEPEILRLAAGHVAKRIARASVKVLGFCLSETRNPAACLRALVEGVHLGGYTYTALQTTKRRGPDLKELKVILPEGMDATDEFADNLALGLAVADAVAWARDRVNEPANVATPANYAAAAAALAKAHGLKATVQGQAEIEKQKMGMFLGVAQGSVAEPKLIHIEYKPKDVKHQKRPAVALVGKAITFDSGGLSLKTQEGMIDMKTDMAGSAAVFAAMAVIGHLKPPFPVHAFVGACENMPSGTATKLGDVHTSRLGKTVEILNTDAEGRLVLGDILAWANDIKPAILVDLATLTGACMVALGRHITGAFGVNDEAVWEVQESAKAAGEELWRLPMSDLQKDQLKSDVADLKNVGERYAGATNAALFLREFVGETPWVHLDIAGPSYASKDRGYIVKGGTGVGVRTLVELVRRRTEVVERDGK